MILRKNKSEKSKLTETSGHRIKVMALTILKNGYKTIDPIEKGIGWILRHHTLNVRH
jgi:hypothetical protein